MAVKVSLTERVSIEARGVVVDEQRFPGRQGRLVFAYLLAAHERPVPRDELAEELWGDTAPATWEKALSVLVSKLRALLNECGLDGSQCLTSAFGCYQLSLPAGTWVDVAAAKTAATAAERALAAGDVERARAEASTAESLARRTFLPGEDGRWVAEKRTELREVLLRALECLAGAYRLSGNPAAGVRAADELVALEPFRERGYRLLMQAQSAAGNDAEALRVYERCRRLLAEELGAYPSPETEAIYRELLEAPVRGTAASTTDSAPGETPAAAEDERRAEEGSAVRRRALIAASTALAIGVAIVAGIVATRGGAGESTATAAVELVGDSVAVIDRGTTTIVAEVPVGGRPTAPAVGEGAVWVGNRDDNTLLKIDPSSHQIVRTIGVDVAPTDVEVVAGSVWVLSDWVLVRIDPTNNDVVAKVRLPRGSRYQPWSFMEVGADQLFVWCCPTAPGALARIDPTTEEVVSVREGPVGAVAFGEGALWMLTGHELDTIEQIDPETNAVVETIPVRRIGEAQGFPLRMAVGMGAIWVASTRSLWRIDAATNRFTGSAAVGEGPQTGLATGEGAVWATSYDGILSRIDPESMTDTVTLPLGSLIYPADGWDAIAVGEGAVWVAVTSYAS